LAAQQYEYPFQNPSLPAAARVANLLSLMTLQEKIAALSTDPSVPRLHVKGANHVEGLHGLALGGPGHWGRIRPTRGETLADIPQPTTQFPQAVGLGQTWDPALIREVGRAEGIETRYLFQSEKYHRGGLVVRAPNADLVRDPRWGRAEESYGEDAFFNGTMAVAMIRGLQGDDAHYWLTAALMKHFLANSNEDGRGGSSSNFDERLFHEYYAVPFRMGVKLGGSRSYMTSYNAVNGIPDTVNPHIREITVQQWGVDGIICTDAGAMTNLVREFHSSPDMEHAAAASIKAGINQFLDDYRKPVEDALRHKLISEMDLDANLRGVYNVMLRLGLLDPPSMVPYSSLGEGAEPWQSEEHKQLARRATQESIVLLKNAGGLLPLDRGKLHSVALIGPYTKEVLLDWYSGTPPYAVSIFDGLKSKLGDNVHVGYNKGDSLASVRALAAQSDVAIVVIGNHPTCDAPWAQCPLPSDGKEGIDRKSLTLEQEAMVKAALEGNPNTIVVMHTSFPFAINWTAEHAPAILAMAHNSEEEGHALADVLVGDYNPGGRLTETWPKSLDQLPQMMDYNIRDGKTYQYFKGEPLFPFGFGLSYTTFAYSDMRIEKDGSVSAVVKNTGSRAGDEVVQLYGKWIHSEVERPQQQLLGFARVTLQPGESKVVTIPISRESLQYYSREKGALVDDKKLDIELLIGSSSQNIRLRDEHFLNQIN
jgi:beta-glucosidase